MTTVLLVDDHPLVLEALRQEIAHERDFDVHTAASLAQARVALDHLQPQIVVCDVRLPDGSGLELIKEARSRDLPVAFLVLSSFDTAQYVTTAQRLGAAGYLLKTEPTESIIGAIRQIAGGGTFFGGLVAEASSAVVLSAREAQVVSGVVAGETNDEIAARLDITRRGVEAHLSHIFERTGTASRTELAVRAERGRWLEGT